MMIVLQLRRLSERRLITLLSCDVCTYESPLALLSHSIRHNILMSTVVFRSNGSMCAELIWRSLTNRYLYMGTISVLLHHPSTFPVILNPLACLIAHSLSH